MPEELSRAEKVAKADQLRQEISSLRLQAEHANAAAAEKVHDEALDAELARLEAEAEAARQRANSSGSVDDALAAMNAAAVTEAAPVVAESDAEVLTPDLEVVAAEKPVEPVEPVVAAKADVTPAEPVEAVKPVTPAMVAKKSTGGNK